MDLDRTRRIVEALTTHQRDLYVYVNTLMAGDSAAMDVVQDTNLDLWAHVDDFDLNRPFLPWAFKFAYHRVLAHRKKQSRSKLVFNDDVLEMLGSAIAAEEGANSVRLAALSKCLRRLSDDQRQLVSDRYQSGLSLQSISAKVKSTPSAIAMQLYRVRRTLGQCIQCQLTMEENAS